MIILAIEELLLNSPIASNFQCRFDVLLNYKGEVILDVCMLSRVFRQIVKKLFRAQLTLKDPFISKSCIQIKTKFNFYFHTYLWCLKRFYEGLFVVPQKVLWRSFCGASKGFMKAILWCLERFYEGLQISINALQKRLESRHFWLYRDCRRMEMPK